MLTYLKSLRGKGLRNLALATDGPEPYQYQVLGTKQVTLSPWGELELIEVEQTGAEHVTFWFAPSLNYALVQVMYHGFLFDGSMSLTAMNRQCL
ncbi:hypothetical protein LZT04_02510 [Vibrio fluvialis]|nr:hypothetical protein [Vibrio fluvialis]